MRCLELAHAGLLAGGLPCGAVVTDGDGTRMSEARNRAYDQRGGSERLQRTAIAHAEMNALAAIDTDTNLGTLRLVSSHRPCQMCSAACAFTGVGVVDFVAPDPSDPDTYPDPDGMPAGVDRGCQSAVPDRSRELFRPVRTDDRKGEGTRT